MRSLSAGIVYGVLSLFFLWMSAKVVDLYGAFPEYFGSDAYFIFGLILAESIVLYVLCAVIVGLHMSDKYKRIFNVSCILFSSVFVIITLNTWPPLFQLLKDFVASIT